MFVSSTKTILTAGKYFTSKICFHIFNQTTKTLTLFGIRDETKSPNIRGTERNSAAYKASSATTEF